jgi:hypothetical protein
MAKESKSEQRKREEQEQEQREQQEQREREQDQADEQRNLPAVATTQGTQTEPDPQPTSGEVTHSGGFIEGGEAGALPSGVAPGSIVPNDVNARNDSDVMQGRFARVVAGEHEGRYGVVKYLGGEPDGDGFPTVAILTTRDDMAEDLEVAYSELAPANAGGR